MESEVKELQSFADSDSSEIGELDRSETESSDVQEIDDSFDDGDELETQANSMHCSFTN